MSLVFGVVACGGGGGGGGGQSGGSFTLADVQYGRSVDDGTGPRLVSPLTTATIDPTTGLLVRGSLEALAPGIDVDAPQSLALSSSYLPRVVPRNGVLELEFTAPIDPASVSADAVDADGVLVRAGSVQVRTQDDKVVPVDLTLASNHSIRVSPFVGGRVGFPPSPIDFTPSGEPRADATGFLKLRLPRSGSAVLRSTRGTFLGQRADALGDPATPIGFNPGNRFLDFIAQEHLLPSNETFNGFLPDKRPPRIVRTHAFGEVLSFAAGDGASGDSLLFEIRIRPQTTVISRQNGFTMAIGILSSSFPKFRIYTLGTPGIPLKPDDIANDEFARCAVHDTANPSHDFPNGDNSRYFAAFDYVKTTSRIRSPWVRVVPGDTVSPDWFPAVFSPPLSERPAGTSVIVEFEGAKTLQGNGGTGFDASVDVADGKPAIAFRATLIGNTTTLLSPTLETVVIPYLRPFGG